MGAEAKGLDGRSRDVLASVVCAYIESATPVSSRQLTKAGRFSLSSASLRNAMADLEEAGFLTHPHVSAGRVPTDLGYRTFVSELMTKEAPSETERARIAFELSPETFELDRFLHATSRVLSLLTGEVGVVAAPAPVRFVLELVHFTRVAEHKLLVAQVSDAGLVESRVIETSDEFSQVELDRISRRLTQDFKGKSLQDIRRQLLASLEEEKVRMDAAFARAMSLGRKAFAAERPAGDSVFVEGTETLLEKPEFRTDVEALRRMFRSFDEKAKIVNLLTDCLAADGASVVIGSESLFTGETQSAVVTAPYRRGDRVLGALGVIGPRRMEYARIVPLVEELGRYVTRRLTEGASS
jgi:heat-inducible transcriptional repressor